MKPEVIFKGKVIEAIRKMSFEHSEELGVFIGKDGKPIKIIFADKLLDEIIKMPPVDSEMEIFPTIDVIPIEWIDEEINRLRSYDNAFSAMAASTIKAMLDKWRNNA